MLLLIVVKQRNMASDQYWIIRPKKMQTPSTVSVASNWLIKMKKKECLKPMKKKRIPRSSFRNYFVKWGIRRVGGIQRPSKPSPPFF